MKRTSFLTLAAAVAVPLAAPRAILAAERVRSIRHVARADRSTLVGTFGGGCASRRSVSPHGGYTFAELR